jgi:hypothetical protein
VWKIFAIPYWDGRLIEMWRAKKTIKSFPTVKKSSKH